MTTVVVRARALAREYRLQWALVLGVGDDADLDAAIVAHRAARARAARPSDAESPDASAEVGLADRLVEAARRPGNDPSA